MIQVKKLSARRRAKRRHPLAAIVALACALTATGGLYAAFAPAKAQADSSSPAQSLAIEQGKKLYTVGCSSCHGTSGKGTANGPSLVNSGAAAVDFQVGTGRMPAIGQTGQVPKKKVIYSQAEIDQLAAYIASLGPGPKVPTSEQYSPSGADVAAGGELFRTNCSQCHNFTGKGGALPSGRYAPNLGGTSAKHMYEAMLTGPQSMPKFPNTVLTSEGKREIIAYLKKVNSADTPTPGGLALGGVGPVVEGLFGWIFGLGALIIVACWVAARTAKARKS